MTAISESSSWSGEVTQLETADLVLGGASGPSNRALMQIANRTRYLYDRINSLTELPLEDLKVTAMPTIDTSTFRMTVTPASATAGGRVSIAAGTRLTLCESVSAGYTARKRSFTTAAYTSADLAASATHYLRARVTSGLLEVYTARGSDTDSVPAGLVGTPNGLSGNGFNTTVLDCLIAKIVTGSAGTTPTVTALANAAQLTSKTALEIPSVAQAFSWTALPSSGDLELNWARMPHAQPIIQGFAGVINKPDGSAIDTVETRHNVKMVQVRKSSASNRYTLKAEYVYQDSSGDAGSLRIVWDCFA